MNFNPSYDFTTVIPKDVTIHHIFSKIEVLDLANCAFVSKRWNKLASIDSIWKRSVSDVRFAKSLLLGKRFRLPVARSFDEILACLQKELENIEEGKKYQFVFKNPYDPLAKIKCSIGYRIPERGKIPKKIRELLWLYKRDEDVCGSAEIKGDRHNHYGDKAKNWINIEIVTPVELNQLKLFCDFEVLFEKKIVAMDQHKAFVRSIKRMTLWLISILTITALFVSSLNHSPTKA